jgi:hypothetical protein
VDLGFDGVQGVSRCLRFWNKLTISMQNRFASALSNYKTVRQHGGQFIFLIHDLWGADGTQNSSAAYPGDNGNCEYHLLVFWVKIS